MRRRGGDAATLGRGTLLVQPHLLLGRDRLNTTPICNMRGGHEDHPHTGHGRLVHHGGKKVDHPAVHAHFCRWVYWMRGLRRQTTR